MGTEHDEHTSSRERKPRPSRPDAKWVAEVLDATTAAVGGTAEPDQWQLPSTQVWPLVRGMQRMLGYGWRLRVGTGMVLAQHGKEAVEVRFVDADDLGMVTLRIVPTSTVSHHQ